MTKDKAQEYVVGFAMDKDKRVALIEKARPPWQKGLLNGIGGKVEDGEASHVAMAREFAEEAGVRLEGWRPLLTLTYPNDAVIHFFTIEVEATTLDKLTSPTDEEVWVMRWVDWLKFGADDLLVPNLTWILPLAAFSKVEYLPTEFVVVRDLGERVRDD